MRFTTIRDESRHGLVLRLLRRAEGGFLGLVRQEGGGELGRFEGAHEADVWGQVLAEAARADKAYVGYDGARARFLSHFAKGFDDPEYWKHERTYKETAKKKLDQLLPLAAVAEGSGHAAAALAAYQGTNLLSHHEKIDLKPLLAGPSGDAFVRAAARFTLGDHASALADMAQLAKPFASAKWTVVTYLPFLWRPEAHIFLKPNTMTNFAACVGHRFKDVYHAGLSLDVYDSLLDLAAETEGELAGMDARDRIDVQSFIWVVGAYGVPEASGD